MPRQYPTGFRDAMVPGSRKPSAPRSKSLWCSEYRAKPLSRSSGQSKLNRRIWAASIPTGAPPKAPSNSQNAHERSQAATICLRQFASRLRVGIVIRVGVVANTLSGSRPTAQRTSAAIDSGNWFSTSDRATALNTSGDRRSSASISEVKCPSIGPLLTWHSDPPLDQPATTLTNNGHF